MVLKNCTNRFCDYTLLGAIALAGTSGFSSCSSEDVVADANPNYNAETQEVNADFVFNVSTGNTATSRGSAANTQATSEQPFRGIDHAVLSSFVQRTPETGDTYTLLDGKSLATAKTANKLFNMGTVMGAGAIDPVNGSAAGTPKSRRVLELSLPTETNTILFWGKAIKTGTDDQQGSIVWNPNKDLSQSSFTLNKRIPDGTGAGTVEAYLQYEDLIAHILTNIVNSSSSYEAVFGGTTYTGTLGWKDYVQVVDNKLVKRDTTPTDDSGDALSSLGEIMADAFVTMNTIYENEVRAGSGPTVARLLADLYNVIHSVATSTPTSKSEAITKAVAAKLETNITGVLEISSRSWKTDLSLLKAASGLAADKTNLVTGDLNAFPTNFHVPNGAATLKFDINTTDPAHPAYTYSYNQTLPTYAMDGHTGGSFTITNYRYPAELCYFGNSPVRVTNDAHQTSDYPDGVTEWDNDASWAAGATGMGSAAWTSDSHVLSSTRSVAMQQNINYGTALLQTTVRYGASTLYDNNANIQKKRKGTIEENATITPAAGTFTLTGIMIGGVEETVGWNYVAKPRDGASPKYFNSFIYDNDLPSTAIPSTIGTKSQPNYTLVWDNWNAANVGGKQNVVYIALEFVNNSGKDFWGMNNLIRNGATFYITGKLDPDEITVAGKTAEQIIADKSLGISWPEKYALPPYDVSGNTIKERRVFMQDFMTTADFVLGPNSLQSALVAVPDLRSTQISLGLSVDLKWETGLNFGDVTLGE